MKTKTTTNLIKTPVNKMLFLMAVPISLGMLSTFLFQVVDTFFVGTLGSGELAALAFSSSIYFLFIALFIGISVGLSSVVAKATGAADLQSAQNQTSLTLLFVFILSIILSFIGGQRINTIFTFLGADSKVLPLVHDYMSILFIGFPFLMLGIVSSGAARGSGIINKTEIIFGIGGLINLLFDYLLIFGIGPFPEMGLAGAAVASVMSFIFISIGNMRVLFSQNLLSFSAISNLKNNIKTSKQVLQIAIPTIGMQLLVPVLGIFTTFILAKFGTEVVAAFGVASRIEALAFVGIFAVSMALTPFVAQNLGANKPDRIALAVTFGKKASLYIGLTFFIILAFFGEKIGSIFSEDEQVVTFVALFFKIVAVSYGFVGIMNVSTAIYTGLQMPKKALQIMMVKTLIFTIPLIIVASFISATAVLVALSIGNILSGIYAFMLMRKTFQQKHPINERVNNL
ncbi:MAG: MATE family efflux transporter [Rhizobiales bacterium]|nr:MATE family efflux transporter [Hyphomicrobiales bacterium]